MKSASITQIENELGQWENNIDLPDHVLHLILEKSDTGLELYLPHPEKELTIIARPKGFQLMSLHKKNRRKDFSIPYDTISGAELLPSFSPGPRTLRIGYLLGSIALFVVLGNALYDGLFMLLWLSTGILFGIVCSFLCSRTYRQNLILRLQNGEDKKSILFTIRKNQKEECIRFFTKFLKEKFIAE
jgi:hypothetical protein